MNLIPPLVSEMGNGVAFAGWYLTYPKALTWLENTGFKTSEIERDRDVLNPLIDMLEDMKLFPEEITGSPRK